MGWLSPLKMVFGRGVTRAKLGVILWCSSGPNLRTILGWAGRQRRRGLTVILPFSGANSCRNRAVLERHRRQQRGV